MIQKAIAVSLLALTLCAVSTVNAQSYSTIAPTYGGGYNVWNSNASYSNVTPIYGGGYNVWNSNGSYSNVTPTYGGGYNVWNSNGSYSNVTPIYGGGYNVWNSNGSYSNVTPIYGGGYNVWNSNRSNRSYGGFDPGIAATYTGPQYLYNGLTALGNGIAEGINRYQEQKRQQAFYDMMLLQAQIAAKREVQRQADQMRAQQVRSATSTAAQDFIVTAKDGPHGLILWVRERDSGRLLLNTVTNSVALNGDLDTGRRAALTVTSQHSGPNMPIASGVFMIVKDTLSNGVYEASVQRVQAEK